jgi:FkbM family methyltransferase
MRVMHNRPLTEGCVRSMHDILRSMSRTVVYGAVDLCTGYRGVRRVISGEPIRFPARWCRYYPSVYEPEKFAFLRQHCRPGDTVLDIGAHIGLFTVLLARLVGEHGRVFSFEPTPLTRSVLAQTVRMNRCSSIVSIRSEAVARSTGTAPFYDTGAPLSNANSLVPAQPGSEVHEVATVSIDDFAATHGLSIQFLKIDAEGGELAILDGARKTLRRDRPRVQLEVHPVPLEREPGALDALWKLLREERMAICLNGRTVEPTWFMRLDEAVELQVIPEEQLAVGGKSA